MANDIFKEFLHGNISSSVIIQSITNDNFTTSPIGNINIEDFVPNFLDYVRAKLSTYLSPQQAASCSPKRIIQTRRNKKKNYNRSRGSRTSLLTRYSTDSQSDNSQSFDASEKFSRSSDHIFSKKSFTQSPSLSCQPTGSRKPKRIELSPCTNVLTPVIKKKDGLANTRSTQENVNLQKTKQSCKEISSSIQKKRITPTLITKDKDTFEQNEETKILFDSSPVLEVSESSLDSDGSASQITANDRKIRKLEKKMRKNQKCDARKMPLAAFLTSEQKNNLQSKEYLKSPPCTPFTPDVQKVYQKQLISSPICTNSMQSITNEIVDIDLQSSFDEPCEVIREAEFSTDSITNKERIGMFVDVYECILTENLVTNITLELYFLFGVLNCKIGNSVEQISDEIFSSAANCIYFAAEVLDRIKNLLVILDKSSLKLLSENERLQILAPSVLSFAKKCLLEVSKMDNDSINVTGHSKSLGIPFQIEIDNRKAFMSDRYFYSFSKLRDRFYGLLRTWEENHLDQEWNIDVELSKDFYEFFQEHDEFPTFTQFSQLFVSQLVEMCKQDFCSSCNKEDASLSTSLPAYLKGTDPAKLQLLEERFVMPLITRGPCPKPHFTEVETFFRVFIKTVNNYQFTVHLKDVLVFRLLQINSNNFHFDNTENRNINEGDEISLIRSNFFSQISEARILAKFLGYIVFLPYSTDSKSRKTDEESLMKQHIIQPFNPAKVLNDAITSGKLILTIPWLVIYLSMMDINSLKLKINHSVFHCLVGVYRRNSFRLRHEVPSLFKAFILVQLGWLFEQPNIATVVSFYQMVMETEGCEAICVKSSENATAEDRAILDESQVIDTALLIRLCPYLIELKMALTCAGARSYRKIKPVPHIDRTTVGNEQKKLKDKMIENFLRYQPKFVKECVEFIGERLLNNLKTQITAKKVPETVKLNMTLLEKDIIYSHDEILAIEVMNKANYAQYQNILLSSKDVLATSIRDDSAVYCDKNALMAVTAVFPADTHHKVIGTAAKIIASDVRSKVAEWTSNRLLSLYENELYTAYHRYLMGIIKKQNKLLTSV